MSLILEALKRSEQERRRERGPDLQTIHQPLAGRAPTRSRTGWWVAALVLANIGIMAGWWLQQRERPSLPASSAPSAQNTAASAAPPPAARPDTVAPTPAKPEPAVAAAPAHTAGPEFTAVTPQNSAQGAEPVRRSDPIREIAELPESVRKGLPAMTFSFHVYSSDPQKRTIIINNRRLREGDEVGDSVLLQEITGDGVVLAIPGYRVHVGVLAGW